MTRLIRRRARNGRTSPWHFVKDFPRVLPYLRPYWRLAVAAVAMIGLGVLASLLAPWPLAIVIDNVLGDKPLPSVLGPLDEWNARAVLIFAVIAGLLVTALDQGLGVVDNYVNTKLEQKMVLDFRSDLFRHAHRLSQAFHDRTRTGALMYQINNQADSAGSIVVSIPPLAQAVATLVGMFVIVYRIDGHLALISLTIVPLVYYTAGYYTSRIQPRLYYVRGLEGQALSIVHEAMAMLRVIVSFGREKHEYGRFRKQGEEAVDARIDVTVRETAFSMAINVITALGTALVLGFGGWKALNGSITPGELLVVLSYIAAVYAPLQQITSTMANLQEHFISLRGALDLLDSEPDIKESPNAREIERVNGRVTFDAVNFSYDGREGTLKEISFDAPAGTRVGIAGPTGAGKSTLVSLIPRFYDAQEGRVLIDGIDCRNFTLKSLRGHISIVHQEPMLFSGTVGENIRYGRLDATEEEIVEAAEAANAHAFISRLPEGYETVLGEGGAQLSVGERQRISVARAFLKNAPILILDEPTSSIDSKTEAVILDALDRLMIGRTTLMIAHRLSTLRRPAFILVVDGGRIVEHGTHDELLGLGGLYNELWNRQIGEEARRAAPTAAELRAQMVGNLARLLEEPDDALRTRAEKALRELNRDVEGNGGERLREIEPFEEGR